MKQQALFKAKRADGKGWVFGNYVVRVSDLSDHCIQIVERDEWGKIIKISTYRILIETICQATPFEIKGKPIFDKDVGRIWLKDDMEENGGFWWYCFVDQVNGCWVLKQMDFDYSDQEWPNDYTFLFDSLEGLEIIGNIHDMHSE
jgi:hypothetical protein